MASSIHPEYPIRRLPRRSRIQAASDPYAWERSVRKNVQRGTGAPVLLGRMSWKGHGASPARREERKKLREARVARNRAKRIQAEADRDAALRAERGKFWDQADDATRRGRTSRKAKEARRKKSKRVPFVGQQWRAGGANIAAAPPGKSKEDIFADQWHKEKAEREAAIIEQLVNEGLITRNIA